MSGIDITYLIIIIVLVVLSGCFSGSETAYTSVNTNRLAHNAMLGDKKAEKALKYAEDYDTTIANILFGNDFINILISSLGSILGMRVFGTAMGNEELGTLVMTIVLTITILIFGEILPKAIAHTFPTSVSKKALPLMSVSHYLFYIFVKPASFIAKKLSSPLIENNDDDNGLASDEELEAMIDNIREEGIIDDDQKTLIYKSLEFKDTSCYEIMTPRVNVFAYDLEDDWEEFIKQKNVFTYSRIPVFKGDMDHVIGYFQAKTLLRAIVKDEEYNIEDFIRPIVSVPRTMEISTVMSLMKASSDHIAVVRDEYGGSEGIITLEDILEEIVGEMWDEADTPYEDLKKTKFKNIYRVKGSMNIDDFFDYFNIDDELIDEDYSTLSGWINDKLGRFAKDGDYFEYEKLDINIKKCSDYYVKEVEVKYHPRRRKFSEQTIQDIAELD